VPIQLRRTVIVNERATDSAWNVKVPRGIRRRADRLWDYGVARTNVPARISRSD